MFHFPAYPPTPYELQAWVTRHNSGQVTPFGNPGITARLTTPPGISQPPTSFIGPWCQGIHTTALKHLTTKQDARNHYTNLNKPPTTTTTHHSRPPAAITKKPNPNPGPQGPRHTQVFVSSEPRQGASDSPNPHTPQHAAVAMGSCLLGLHSASVPRRHPASMCSLERR